MSTKYKLHVSFFKKIALQSNVHGVRIKYLVARLVVGLILASSFASSFASLSACNIVYFYPIHVSSR